MKTLNKSALLNTLMEAISDESGMQMDGANLHKLRRNLSLLLDASLPRRESTQTKEVTILLSDLRGFTATSERYPLKVVIDLLNDYFSRMTEVIVGYGGTIDKFMGDAIMVLFGAPESQADDLERAIACSVEMQKEMLGLNALNRQRGLPELYMGIGINTGMVVAGTLGSELHNEYTVIGDEVNLVSRIEAYSLRGQILLSKNSYQLAKDFIDVNPPNHVTVKGKRGAVVLYELLATHRPERLEVPRIEIRKSPRIPVHMPIIFNCLSGKQVLPEPHHGEVVDLSYNGMLLQASEGLEAMSDIVFQLSLTLMAQACQTIYGKILHVFECEIEGHCNYSVEFTGLDGESETAIKSYIDRAIGG